MKENKEKLNGKKAVTCTPVDWEEYRVKKEEKAASSGKKSKKGKQEWEAPVVDEKWAVDTGDDVKVPADADMKEIRMDAVPEKKADAADEVKSERKTSKKKSLNAKLNELGNSNWVSTGNFRHEDDKNLDKLGDKIIDEAAGGQDEFLTNAMRVVSDALKEGEESGGVLKDDGLASPFDLPKLDIHFGDTAELKDISREIEHIEKTNIDQIVREKDLAAAIESQTAREIKQKEDEDMVASVKEGTKGKKKSKSRSASPEETGEETVKERSSKERSSKERSAKDKTAKEKTAKGKSPKERAAKSKNEEILELEEVLTGTAAGAAAGTAAGAAAGAAGTRKSSKKKKSSSAKDPDKVVIRSEEVAAEAAEAAKAPAKTKKSGTKSGSRSSSKSGTKSGAKSDTAAGTKKRAKTAESSKSSSGKSAKSASGAAKSSRKKKAAPEEVKAAVPVRREPEIAKDKPAQPAGPSDFRKKSADWKDVSTQRKAARISLIKQKREEFGKRIRSITPLQWSMVAMALVIFFTGIMTSAVYANYQGEQNKLSAIASLKKYKEDENYKPSSTSVTEEELPEAADEADTVEAKVLSLEMSSVEKDLKIRLIDDEDTLVKDVSWSVTVTSEGGDGGDDDDDDDDDGDVYEDDDKDGTIYITDIAAGDYAVTLNPSDSLSEYVLPNDKQLVSVKAAIEYKVIANIKDEIKSEKEVNVALEDPNGNQAADVETGTALTDTVEWVESSREAAGEEYVEATPDISKTAASVKKEAGWLTALKNIGGGSKKTVSDRSILGFKLPVGYKVAVDELIVEPDDGDETDKDDDDDDDDNNNGGEDSGEVEIVADSLEISGDSSVKVDQSITLVANAKVTSWYTDVDGYVDLTPNGVKCKVAGKKEGTVKVYAEGPAGTDYKEITVKSSDSASLDDVSISISGPSSVAVNSKITIKANCNPSDATVEWSVDDIGDIVKLEDNHDKTCSITGKSEGKVTLTASMKYGDTKKTVSMEITVGGKEEKNYSDSAQIYDSAKNPLYVKDSTGDYRLATYGDYKSGNFSKYYRKQEGYLYTGWQTIDGKTYYYKKDHNFVTGEQIIQGVKYSFGSDGVLSTGSGTLGIDVSKYQPNINWSSVKASGVSYVIIRCGYRGASTGALIQDPYFTSHIKGAKAAGLKVGVYFFTTALNEQEAVEEASMCAALCQGYGINYPIFIDCETSSRPGYNSLSSSERTAIIRAFCSTIKSAGYTPGVYANKTWLTERINASALSGCKIWLAQYSAGGPTYSGHYDIWQYTSKGKVDGIPGNVDMNQSYLGY